VREFNKLTASQSAATNEIMMRGTFANIRIKNENARWG